MQRAPLAVLSSDIGVSGRASIHTAAPLQRRPGLRPVWGSCAIRGMLVSHRCIAFNSPNPLFPPFGPLSPLLMLFTRSQDVHPARLPLPSCLRDAAWSAACVGRPFRLSHPPPPPPRRPTAPTRGNDMNIINGDSRISDGLIFVGSAPGVAAL